MDNNLKTKSKTKAKTKQSSQNFIEAIRDVGGSFKSQAKDLTGGVANGALNSLMGKTPDNVQYDVPQTNPNQAVNTAPNPNRPFNFEEYLNSREKQIRSQERGMAQRLRENEKVLYNRSVEENKKQILCVKEDIKKIIKETKGVAIELIEAEKTVSTTIVTSGTYHINFFARIRSLLAIARKRISESRSWLEMFNSRKNRKHLYWGQVKKSGTKFMLSAERYMSTQAG